MRNKKCTDHNMEMIETNHFGYTNHCKNCGETYTFNSNDKTPMVKFILFSMGCAVIIWLIGLLFGYNILEV